MNPLIQNRRSFLSNAGIGIGSTALTAMLGNSLQGATSAWPANLSTSASITPKAKRIIFLCMAGGPSHLETLDDKPKLREMHGKPMPKSFTEGQPIAQLQGKALKCLGPQHAFEK